MSPNTSIGWKAAATPALFAQQATAGRFQIPRHIQAISRAIRDTLTGRSEPILLIEAPPRHGKSELVSKFLPPWYLGVWPERRVMLAAYEATFARSWGRKARTVFQEAAAPIFGRRLAEDNHAADDWSTTAGGGMTTAGVGGPMTGRGANLLIIDDPVKNAEEALSKTTRDNHWDWWQSTASTRLEPGGVVIGIMTRWHEDDIFGRLMRTSGSEIRRLTLPALAEHGDPIGRKPGEALWPERYSREKLEAMRAGRSEYWWRAMFQQRPGKWGESKWGQYLGERVMAARWPESFEFGVVAVDPSLGADDRKGDYSAIVFAGKASGKLWIAADVKRRSESEIAVDAVEMFRRHRANLMVLEGNGFQRVLAESFHVSAMAAGISLPLQTIVNTGNKVLRVSSLGPLLAADLFRFRDDAGTRLLLDQLGEFPRGDHDDGPDALEMAVRSINVAAFGLVDDSEELAFTP
jgi:predicted phage terminase large subunit-like protein